MNTQTTMPPHIVTTITETRPMGAVTTDTERPGTVPGTRIGSRTTMSATNNAAVINPRIATVTRMEKSFPKKGMRLGSGTGMFTSANDFCPFFLKSCIREPSDKIFEVYIAIM